MLISFFLALLNLVWRCLCLCVCVCNRIRFSFSLLSSETFRVWPSSVPRALCHIFLNFPTCGPASRGSSTNTQQCSSAFFRGKKRTGRDKLFLDNTHTQKNNMKKGRRKKRKILFLAFGDVRIGNGEMISKLPVKWFWIVCRFYFSSLFRATRPRLEQPSSSGHIFKPNRTIPGREKWE